MTKPPSSGKDLEALLLANNSHAGICAMCAGRPGLHIVEGVYVGLCATCVGGKIARLRGDGMQLPPWVVQLEREVQHEIRYQERKARKSLGVSCDDLYRCVKCGRIIQAEDARYPANYPEPGIPPHCMSCYEAAISS